MAFDPNPVDFSLALEDFLAQSVDDGTYSDILHAEKRDRRPVRATRIKDRQGQLWSNLLDSFIESAWPVLKRGDSPSGVTPGNYTNATITVDQYGRVTAASTGSGGGGAATWAEVLGTGLISGGFSPRITGSSALEIEANSSINVLDNQGSPVVRAQEDWDTATSKWRKRFFSAAAALLGTLAVNGATGLLTYDAAAQFGSTLDVVGTLTAGASSFAAPVNVTKSAGSSGVATTFARSDHKHDISTAAAVSTGAANAEGSATSLARSDHTHAVTDLAIASQAQGDVLYRNASNWTRLAAGTSGQVLKTNGGGANPEWATITSLTSHAWSQVLAAGRTSGGSSPQITSGQKLEWADAQGTPVVRARLELQGTHPDQQLVLTTTTAAGADWNQIYIPTNDANELMTIGFSVQVVGDIIGLADLNIDGTAIVDGSVHAITRLLVTGGSTNDVSASFDDVIVGDGSATSRGTTYKAGATGSYGFVVAEGATTTQSYVLYDTGNDRLRLGVENNDRVWVTTTALRPPTAGATALGTSGEPWSDVRAQAATISGNIVAAAANAFIDAGDGTGSPQIRIFHSDAGIGYIKFFHNGVNRFDIYNDADADLAIARRDGSGVFADESRIAAATGNWTLPAALTVGGNVTLNSATATLAIGSSTATGPILHILSAVANASSIHFQAGSTNAWSIFRRETSRDFELHRRDSGGSLIDAPISVAWADGGAMLLTAPNSATGTGGTFTARGGISTDGNGGSASLLGRNGVGTNRSGGSLSLTGGDATGSGSGGNVALTAGDSPSGTKGTIGFVAGGSTRVVISNLVLQPNTDLLMNLGGAANRWDAFHCRDASFGRHLFATTVVAEPSAPSTGAVLYLFSDEGTIELRVRFANGTVKTIANHV